MIKNVLNLSLRLLAIALIAGLLLAGVYGMTKQPIADYEAQKEEAARKAVMPGASEFELVSENSDVSVGIVNVYSCEMGSVYTIKERGYSSSGVTVTVGIDNDGKVTGIEVNAANETPGLGAKAGDSAFTDQFAGQSGSVKVDTISGATMTSNAVIRAVDLALSDAAK